MEVLYLGYMIFLCLFVAVFVFNYLLAKYYTQRSESNSMALVIVTCSISLTLISTLLIPIDIFLSSSDSSQDTMGSVLLWLMIMMLVLAFIVTPFVYFYVEEGLDEIDDLDQCERLTESAKFTAGFMLICSVLIIIGLLFRPDKEHWGEGREWIKNLFDVDHVGEAALSFIVAALTILGLCLWSFYSAYGMSTLPVVLIRGSKSLEATKDELETDVKKITEKIKYLEQRSTRSNTSLTKREKKEKAQLERHLSKIVEKSEKIKEKQKDNSRYISKLIKVLTPFRMMLGVAAGVLSVLYWVTMVLTGIDKMLNSDCGLACGFISTNSSVINPFDSCLVFVSNYFPTDYFVFGVLSLYIFVCSFYGIVQNGIKLCYFVVSARQNFPIKKKRTMPQALLLCSVYMMFIFLAMAQEFLTVLPRYMTFGSQFYMDESDKVHCSLETFEADKCQMSVSSAFFNK